MRSATIAQPVEHRSCKAKVASANLAGGSYQEGIKSDCSEDNLDGDRRASADLYHYRDRVESCKTKSGLVV